MDGELRRHAIVAFRLLILFGPSVEYVYDIYWLTGLVLFSLMPYVKLTFFQQKKRSKGVAKNLPINLTRELCFERSLHNFSHTLILATFLTPFHFNPFLLLPLPSVYHHDISFYYQNHSQSLHSTSK